MGSGAGKHAQSSSDDDYAARVRPLLKESFASAEAEVMKQRPRKKDGSPDPLPLLLRFYARQRGLGQPALSFCRVQLIAFEICTLPGGFDKAIDEDFFLGVGGNVQEDLRQRAAIASIAFEVAAESDGIDRSHDCLKLFMLPECFWRSARGPFDVDKMFALLRRLMMGYSEEQYRDWMFVFGSVCGYDTEDAVGSWKEDQKVSFSLAPVSTEDNKSLCCVLSHLKSGIDWLSSPTLGGIAEGDLSQLMDKSEWIEGVAKASYGSVVGEGGVFNSRGISFGLENCLEHAAGKLVRKGGAKVQVQLIPSFGVKVDREHVVGDLVFQCDGLTDGASAYGAHSRAFRRLTDGSLEAIEERDYQVVLGDGWQEAIKNLYLTPPNDVPPAIRVYMPVDVA